ncbi:MAG TPA: MFS transporter [Candidatus Kapabacteria bacterium]|nr:MFS transporter [Candidatus Kapabacteria bacterium]
MKEKLKSNPINLIVIVAALGYFVDIYDLIIFGIVKDPSLIALGITAKQDLFSVGNHILRMQMLGMLLGGVVWGILGDKKGRLSTLFATILLYSLANIANGFVTSVEQYAVLRFIAGFGLAGELGVGITLVAEVMSASSRGKGTGIVSGIGILGAALGFIVAEWLDWRSAYWFGGGMGLLLLFLRVIVHESAMYNKVKRQGIKTGDFLGLFKSKLSFQKYFLVILIGIPTWYAVSVLVINSPSFADTMINIDGQIKGSVAVMLHYFAASIGSVIFSYVSEKMKSRKKAISLALVVMFILTCIYFVVFNASPFIFYTIIFLLGLPMGGLWTLFITMSSELFGTNIRATVTTSAPNFVRGAVVIVTLMLDYSAQIVGLWWAGLCLGVAFYLLSYISNKKIEETYGKELDYLEN